MVVACICPFLCFGSLNPCCNRIGKIASFSKVLVNTKCDCRNIAFSGFVSGCSHLKGYGTIHLIVLCRACFIRKPLGSCYFVTAIFVSAVYLHCCGELINIRRIRGMNSQWHAASERRKVCIRRQRICRICTFIPANSEIVCFGTLVTVFVGQEQSDGMLSICKRYVRADTIRTTVYNGSRFAIHQVPIHIQIACVIIKSYRINSACAFSILHVERVAFLIFCYGYPVIKACVISKQGIFNYRCIGILINRSVNEHQVVEIHTAF